MHRAYSLTGIDNSFYNNFMKWHDEKDFALNTKGKSISILKSVLRWAESFTKVNTEYRDFRKHSETVYQVYQSIDELQKFYKKKLPQRLERIRDLHILRSFLGIRIGDGIEKDAIYTEKGKSFIRIITKKTGSIVVIPIHKVVKEILMKYKYNIPKISDAKYNEYIKEAAEESKINQWITQVRTIGGVRKESKKKKHQLITTHTARRSFATNMFLAGVPIKSISILLGHATVKTTENYIKVTQEDNARLLSEHAFFK